MHLDKSKMGGRLNEVTIRWSGEDEARAQKYIFLRPKYLVSKVRVVKDLACDVVFCLQEIQDKQLDMQITGGLFTEPPDANTDPTVYQNHLDEQSKIRKLKAKITGSKKTTQQSSTTSVQSGSANAHGASGH
ncbi:hypothetical protein GTA08_BOTSDO08061 [Botryosphaeria dothidea]|uniref:Uncharacterized protein n=1 Tax=Botryosphaeria dothidea TaxID=55169 RepID=A0A8H4MZA0_9PEZI|nr:hypothetical protein GTA08_BOTSDO08061 [Botryosphaeria dothidea]